MKLICLNCGLFEKNNAKLADFFQHQKAEILCLQEVTRRVDHSARPDFSSKESIDAVTKELKHQFFAPIACIKDFRMNDFHGKEVFSIEFGGFLDYSYYVKSVFPIQYGKLVFLQNQFTLLTDWSTWPEQDYRAVHVADIIVGGKPIRLMNYHGFWSKDKKDTPRTMAASQTILDIAHEVNYPIILCGDFNLFPDTESIKMISDQFTSLVDQYHINSTRPDSNELHQKERNVIDYIFVSDEIKVKNFTVPNIDTSDHLPLIMEFN